VSRHWTWPLALICCQAAFAQQAPASKPAEPIEEVEINAAREKLRDLRAELVRMEDQFYAKYNEMNKDDQYDVVCHMEARTGTILKSRVCRPVYENDATEAEARALLDGRSAPPASMVVLSKYPDFRKNMLDLMRKSPELRRVVKDREALEKRYQAVRKKKFEGKVVVFE
jgi:hypothetical protein